MAVQKVSVASDSEIDTDIESDYSISINDI